MIDNEVAIKFIDARVGYGDGASRKSIREKVLFDHLNIEFERGKFYTILGVSGIGKTSLLKTIAKLNKLLDGDVVVNGEVAILFQEPRLFPHMNVIENVSYPLKLLGVKKDERNEIAKDLLTKLGISDKIDSNIFELSGGEVKRVSIARAIIRKPKILLLDEPLTNLDTKLKISIRNLIKHIHDENQFTTIMVTHDIFDSMMISDKLIVLADSKVVASGDVDKVINDDNCKWYFEDFKTEIREVMKKI